MTSLVSYLPSARFSTIAGSVLLSALLIYGAHALTAPQPPAALVATPGTQPPTDWQETLEAVQADSVFNSLQPVPPSTVNEFLQAAVSNNMTQSLARTLFVNLSSAKSQGLGDDIPTQDKLLEEAAARARTIAQGGYRMADLALVPPVESAVRAYANQSIALLIQDPRISARATYEALGSAVDYGNKAEAAKLAEMEQAYRELARKLSELPVPQTLSPLHLLLVNNMDARAAAHADMAAVLTDPIRGLGGVQQFQLLEQEAGRIFTNIAEALRKSGILFTKDEAGSAWSVFLVSP